MRDFCNAAGILLTGGLLAACGTFASVNEKAGVDRPLIGFETEKKFSGAFTATRNIPWMISSKCRNEAAWDRDKWGVSSPDEIWPTNSSQWETYCKNHSPDENFIAMALSGGGHRAGAFAAAVIFELQSMGVMNEVDVISSVSGGSITAAYFALTCDDNKNCPETVEGTPRPEWDRKTVKEIFSRNMELRWFGNWFWPDNIARYWFTAYDRSNIMSETLADNMYDTSSLGNEGFRFNDLNPQRPALIINSTNFTDNIGVGTAAAKIGTTKNSDDVGSKPTDDLLKHLNFTFTQEDFSHERNLVCSDLGSYPISSAVMASSAFPAVFPFVTLENYCGEGKTKKYVHLFDGGTSDNLGLLSLKYMLDEIKDKAPKPKRVVIIQVDASLGFAGKSSEDADARSAFDYFVDTNALDSVDTLMLSGNRLLQDKVDDVIKKIADKNACRIHLALRDIKNLDNELWEKVRKIGTRYQVQDDAYDNLVNAASALVKKKITPWNGKDPLSNFKCV